MPPKLRNGNMLPSVLSYCMKAVVQGQHVSLAHMHINQTLGISFPFLNNTLKQKIRDKQGNFCCNIFEFQIYLISEIIFGPVSILHRQKCLNMLQKQLKAKENTELAK